MALFEDLILKGYFPSELTPSFVTEELVKVFPEMLLNINTYSPSYPQKPHLSKPVIFSIPKIKKYRRYLGIPNPLSMIRLSTTIDENWKAIETFINKSPISLSKIVYPSTGYRAVNEPNFSDINNERLFRSVGLKYLLILDISQFYHSIYTHSIPWALHGKSIAKNRRKRGDLFGNALDEDSRNIQDGQTIGLPIGPDTSRIISEIIASAIDVEICSKIGALHGIRNVDDYYLYFQSLDELEKARSIIQRILKEYGLDLNISKDKIFELPEIIEPEWKNEIRRFKFRESKRQQRTDIISFFDKVFNYARQYPNDYVLNYGITKIRGLIIQKENWDVMESLLLKSILLEPRVIHLLNEIIIGYYKYGHPINECILTTSLSPFVEYHLLNENHFEVIWALWLFKSIKIPIPLGLAKSLNDAKNPLVILTILDLFHAGLIPDGLNTNKWTIYCKEEHLFSEYWILAYEAKIKNWLKSKTEYLDKNPFFKLLKINNVEFYKLDKEIDYSKLTIYYGIS